MRIIKSHGILSDEGFECQYPVVCKLIVNIISSNSVKVLNSTMGPPIGFECYFSFDQSILFVFELLVSNIQR